jgi:hypothetical protein
MIRPLLSIRSTMIVLKHEPRPTHQKYYARHNTRDIKMKMYTMFTHVTLSRLTSISNEGNNSKIRIKLQRTIGFQHSPARSVYKQPDHKNQTNCRPLSCIEVIH